MTTSFKTPQKKSTKKQIRFKELTETQKKFFENHDSSRRVRGVRRKSSFIKQTSMHRVGKDLHEMYMREEDNDQKFISPDVRSSFMGDELGTVKYSRQKKKNLDTLKHIWTKNNKIQRVNFYKIIPDLKYDLELSVINFKG